MGMLLLCAAAAAAGFHFLQTEALVGTNDAGVPEAGVGAGAVSDALKAWITFGEPGPVRAWRFESRPLGPVLGYVPPAFREIVTPPPVPFLLPWTPLRLGGDTHTRKSLEADVATHLVLNLPGFADVDPRHAFAGPSAGVGLNGTWWRGWKDDDAAVMTGKLTGEAGFLAGLTLRDTWWVQADVIGQVDLFGARAWNIGTEGVTGVYLARVGVPLGLELRARLDHGDDTVTTERDTTWSVRAGLFYRLAPEFQTRIEERIEEEERRAAGI